MPTAKEYRQQAQEYLKLAKEATEPYAIRAMMELAEEFNKAADNLELSCGGGSGRQRDQAAKLGKFGNA